MRLKIKFVPRNQGLVSLLFCFVGIHSVLNLLFFLIFHSLIHWWCFIFAYYNFIYWQTEHFPLAADNVWLTELTLIHTNIRSVHNSHVDKYQSVWRQTHYNITDKKSNISFEGIDRHITSITARSIGLA